MRDHLPWHGWQYDVRTGQNEFDRAIGLRTTRCVSKTARSRSQSELLAEGWS